jgi:acyl-CoA hydrolase
VVSCRLSRSEWEGEEICSGFFFMVAVDSDMRPAEIPQFTPETDEEKGLWNRAQAARDAMG